MNQASTNQPVDRSVSHDLQKFVHVMTSVDITATPEQVFALIEDLPRKTVLCPQTAVIRITKMTEGTVDVGTVFHHRVTVDGHIADYHNTVVELIQGQRMVTESDSNPSFRIEVDLEPLASGTRLTQHESFPLNEFVLPMPSANGWLGKLFRFFFGSQQCIRQGGETLQREVDEMQQTMQPRLDAWLKAIKCHLENPQGRLDA